MQYNNYSVKRHGFSLTEKKSKKYLYCYKTSLPSSKSRSRFSGLFWKRKNPSQKDCTVKELPLQQYTVKPDLSGHSKIDKTKILMTNGSSMKVENITECFPWSILQYL